MTVVLYTKSQERPTTLTTLHGVLHQVRARQRPHRSQGHAANMCRRTITEAHCSTVIPLSHLELLDR